MNLRKTETRSGKGMALLLVLAVVVVLSILVAGLWEATQPGWDESALSRARFQAGMLAESGANVAAHPDVEPGDVALRHDYGDGRTYEVRITTEGGRVLVNSLNDEMILDGVREMFILWGVDANSAAIAAESLADWIDTDSDQRSNGAENPYYSGLEHDEFPPNQDFTSLEQLLFVRGMDKVARAQPLWRDYFTVYGDGLIDVNAAPADWLEAFFGTTRDSALNFVATRDGEDGITGTEDDYRFEDVGEVQTLLGVSSTEWNDFSALVTLSGSLRRIESIGRVGDHQVKRVLLVEVSGEGQNESATPVARLSE